MAKKTTKLRKSIAKVPAVKSTASKATKVVAKATPIHAMQANTVAQVSAAHGNALQSRFAGRLLSLSAAMEADDEEAFMTEIDAIVSDRDDGLWAQLRKLTDDLQSALERFQLDSRLVDLAEKEVPDAKNRLDHVMKMTDEAAHKTMDLVEQSGPLAGNIAKQAAQLANHWQQFMSRSISPEDFRTLLSSMDGFLASAQHDSEKVRANLAEVLMAQGYQDLTGQIIRGVIKLVTEVEHTLGDLVNMANIGESHRGEDGDHYRHTRGHGPVVPGVDHGVVVGGQNDVDDLLFNLGM